MEESSSLSIQDQLKELRDAVAENTSILKAMRRDALIGGIVKFFIYGGLFAASLYFSWLYLEPMLGSFSGATDGSGSMDIQKLLELYQKQTGQ